MVAQVAQVETPSTEKPSTETPEETARFVDLGAHAWAEDAVKSLITSGLVNGKSGKIVPTDYTTRAEVAVLLKRILDYTNK